MTFTANIFCGATLEQEARFFVTALVQVVQQIWFSVAWEQRGEFVESREQRQQIRFWICSGEILNRFFQFEQRLQNRIFRFGHAPLITQCAPFRPQNRCMDRGKLIERIFILAAQGNNYYRRSSLDT